MADMTDPRLQRDPERPAAAGAAGAAAGTAGPGAYMPRSQQPLTTTLQCCCGRTGCIYLLHNCSVLEGVEKDVRTAAKLGQSLLERHEAYMADAERDRAELVKRVEQLEMDKKELEAENAKKIEENRALLDQLEALNNAVTASDTHVTLLEASLQSSQQTIRRLEGAAERAEAMERHLAALEAEQAVLQNSLVTSESEARYAIQRWKRAERGIADLQHQLEQMEKEAREEQERHLEVVGRMERQRAVEKELNTAAGRLKGAAAARSLQENNRHNGSGVVTHFVRDLLQDNANLQLGIGELRAMLMASNDEIQLLRDQLMFHQPLADDDAAGATAGAGAGAGATSATPTLRAELEVEGSTADTVNAPETPGESAREPSTPTSSHLHLHQHAISQDLRVHHYYHVGKKAEPKKARKKRTSLTPSVFTPPSTTFSTSPFSRSALPCQQDPPEAAMSPFRLDTPSPRSFPSRHMSKDSESTTMSGLSNRFSVFSDQPSDLGLSSGPSSPQTNPRYSVFDRTTLSDLSLPVSPTTSVDPLSPLWRTANRVQGIHNSLSCALPPPPAAPLPANQSQMLRPTIKKDKTTIADEDSSDLRANDTDDLPASDFCSTDTADHSTSSESATPTPTQNSPFPLLDAPSGDYAHDLTGDGGVAQYVPPTGATTTLRTLHRAVSHESIISLRGGLDIHTLKVRPSQLTLRPLGTVMADTGVSSVTARPVLTRSALGPMKSDVLLRDSLAPGGPLARGGSRVVSNPLASASPLSGVASMAATRKLGKFVAWRPWGGTTGAPTVEVTQETTPAITAPTAATESTTATATTAVTTNAIGPTGNSAPAIDITPATSTSIISTPLIHHNKHNNNNNNNNDRPVAIKTRVSHSTLASLQDRDIVRSPGINQPGAVPGFLEHWANQQRRGAPSKVHPDTVDAEALRDGLDDQ
ncbi:hypothetical protein SPI_09347 [Niveomyces insectorum RCEF 264]|uniref:Uncharacterized protein n=1 Tax=Niveomyces insectorum RCEF 264 TaxID=1081102 RepID=A0A162MB56_9HYPO|nr:hypothetical protein SPI_09347 [Niveomyces insectorum RCEF 264]